MSGSKPLRAAVVSRKLVAAGLERATSQKTQIRGYRRWSRGFEAVGCDLDGTVILIYHDDHAGHHARRDDWKRRVRKALADFDVRNATSAAADLVVRRKEAP